ncbi:ABC transporter permease/M1 family aminopeptidase [Rhodocytophaga aerolata]|nr:M1 family aminopeptidase [Rhodocytophaga aerolata]
MVNQIISFELKYRSKRPATYIYFLIFFLLPFLAMVSDVVQIGGGNGRLYKNTPFIINNMVIILSIIGTVVASAVMSVPVYRDLEQKVHTFYYTFPINKTQYLSGRFIGSFLVLLFIFLSVELGIFAATLWPSQPDDQLVPFQWQAYLRPFVVFLLPNLLFTGTIFFALVALTRTIMAAYLGSVVFLVAYLIALDAVSTLEDQWMVALIDPFGISASEYVTRYWTIAEKNTALLPIDRLILLNRLIWISISLCLLGLTYLRFDLSLLTRASAKKASKKQEKEVISIQYENEIVLPKVKKRFHLFASYRKLISLAVLETVAILKDIYFIAILAAGVIFLGVDAYYSNRIYGTPTYPLTYLVLAIKEFNFILFAVVITIFYAGELVWRERVTRVATFADAFPVPNWLSYGSKLLALYAICCILCICIMVVGLATQLLQGYTHLELDLYIKELFLLTLPFYLMLATFSFFVQVLVNNKFIGHLLVILLFIINTLVLPQLDYPHHLYRFATRPDYIYSDMNGYGHFRKSLFWFTLYWSVFTGILIVVGNVFWRRGTDLRPQYGLMPWATLFLLGVSFCAIGGYIYFNTNVLNAYYSPGDQSILAADYEKQYKQYQHVPQPRITDVKLQVDLFPEERRVYIQGTYILQNKTNRIIDSLHINTGTEADLHSKIKLSTLQLDNKPGRNILTDNRVGYYIYKLPQPLQPGQRITMQYTLEMYTLGFRSSTENNQLVKNGTFFNSNLLPSIGYNPDAELAGNTQREDLGLPAKERMASVTDSAALKNNYISRNADWITFEATLSTTPDQIAIAPGYLQKEWLENGRRYFQYTMDAKMLNFYSFLSAHYQVKKDVWQPKDTSSNQVNIEIYYHPGHEYNLGRMIKSVKQSLDYFTQNFSPYQHRQIRIIEFPRYATFAQSFPNTIPYSESLGFIARVSDKQDDIDYPYYITAHEVAHQWWAHQVIGGHVQGATFLSESLSQYAALMVMEKEYGKEQMKRFLRYELDNYLTGRSAESEKELPLYKVENQDYIHYNKGSLAMYTLRDYIGEDKVNQALAAFIKQTSFQEPPYTNSLELLTFIEKATPDSLHYLLTDLFKEITLYENRVTDATYQHTGGNKYKVALQVEAKKLIADSLGYERETALNDWIEIGVFAEENSKSARGQKPLYLAKHRLHAGSNSIEVAIEGKPARAGIDPYYKLIDRNPEDNTQPVKLKRK